MQTGDVVTPEIYHQLMKRKYPVLRAKYGHVPTDGFCSKREAKRYRELELLEKLGVIRNLRWQVRYPLDVNGNHICDYIADFCYEAETGPVVEDCKGFATQVFKLKAKLMKAVWGIDILLT